MNLDAIILLSWDCITETERDASKYFNLIERAANSSSKLLSNLTEFRHVNSLQV